ncbi:MAG: M20/M25/M40 family metallo-hydrolase [Planctomycetaceae bacterium]
MRPVARILLAAFRDASFFASFAAVASLPAAAAELMSAAHASIRAAEAGQHVMTLADDAFEGREGGSRGGRAAGAYIVEQLQKLGLEPAGDDGSFFQSFGGMRNILGLLRGRDPAVAQELIVVGAHYDHVGYGNAATSYGPFGYVHNGADDNASGVAGLLEVAAALEHLPQRPRRPILVAFWDGEEKGLLGSYHFLRVQPAALTGLKTVFSLNLDMIGRLRGRRLEVYGARTSPGLRAAIVQANADPAVRAGLELAFDWDITDDSDHYPFIAAGIPTVMFHTGLHDQYHRPSDDVHLVNMDGIEPVARLTLGFVAMLADESGPPRPFRRQCRAESNAMKRALEAIAPEPVAAERGRWGIGSRPDPGEPTAPVIVRVSPGSPAAAGGLQPGDRLIAIDGGAITSQDDMLARLRAAGTTTTIDVDRRGAILQVTLRSEPSRQ